MTPATMPLSTVAKDAGSDKLHQLLGDLRKLPLLPATAQKAMAFAHEENASLQELCGLLERDVTLASSILKLANSPFYNWGRTVDSLEQAVVRLGLRECQNLIMAISMRNVFNQTDPVTKGLCSVLWHHCFLTACLCRRLNRELHFDYHGQEFTGGLLHDLGRILLAVTVPDQFRVADPMDFVETDDILQREGQLLETNHCELGTIYAEQNGLPVSTVAVIRNHHHIEKDPENRRLLSLVAMADHMANYLQRREDPQAYDLSLNPGFPTLSQGWSSEKATSFAKLIPHVLMETANAASQQPVQKKPLSSMHNPRPNIPAPDSPRQNATVWGNVKSMLGL